MSKELAPIPDVLAYLRDTVQRVRSFGQSLLEASEQLYRVKTEKLYEGYYNSWDEFLEDADINRTMAERITQVYKHFVLEGGKSIDEIKGLGYSKLYTARDLIDTVGVDKTLAMVKTLKRREIEEELKEDKHGVHACEAGSERWGVCQTCGKFIRV